MNITKWIVGLVHKIVSSMDTDALGDAINDALKKNPEFVANVVGALDPKPIAQ